MKDQMLKIAKVKSEKEFYKKYPTEEAFMKAHGKAFKKAAMGTKMVDTQLTQLTDWSNPPQAQDGGIFNIAKAIGGAFTTPGKAATATSAGTAASGGLGDVLGNMFGGEGGAKGIMDAGQNIFKGGFKSGIGQLGTKAGLGAAGKAAGMGLLNAAPQILEGIGQIGEQKKAIKKADQMSQISGLTAQAAESRDISQPNNQYVRPEDQMIQGLNPQGSGTNFLAAYGASIGGNPTEIQNTYNPGNLYSDLGYEPLNDSNPKQFRTGGELPKAAVGFSDLFQSSGQASIGKGVGSAIGNVFGGPLGGMVGGFLGGIGGNLAGGAADAQKLQGFEDVSAANRTRIGVQNSGQAIQRQYGSSLEDGGWVSNEWQPQVIATFGEHKVKDLLKPPYDADMLRSGGHLAQVNYTPPSAEAMFTGRRDMPYQMENGGYMAMGGDLEVHRGKADPISYNPFLPEGGETVMFKGPSHDDGGMPISYGQNGVEVEGGEPAVKLADGGSPDGNLVVFGNMKIDDMAANHIGVEASKGKKYKSFINDLSKFEARQNKVVSKGTELVDASDTNDPFDQLAMNSGRAMMMGGNAKLLNAAIIKERAAGVQNAILDTAKEYGIKSDEIAQGKFVIDKDSDMAKYGAKMETAQDGTSLKGFLKTPLAERKKLAKELGYTDYSGKDVKQQQKLYNLFKSKATPPAAPNPYAIPDGFSQKYDSIPLADYAGPEIGGPSVPTFANLTDDRGPNYNWATTAEDFANESIKPIKEKGKGKFDWKGLAEGVASNLAPIFRPSNQEGLDPNQLYPEMFALASNQLEPVNAQQYNPRLKQSYNISLQDQLNEVDSQVRAATKMIGSNPSAAAQIFAQAADAKNKIRGEQFRMNQANQIGTQNANIDTLNQAQMQNLQLLDQQYGRQAQAKSNTKAQTLEALKSIAAKTAQNKLENRQLGIMENMYNYRFGPNGQAYNVNDPYRFNNPTVGSTTNTFGQSNIIESQGKKYRPIDYDNKTGQPTKFELVGKNGAKIKARNGSIVKALKSL